MQLINGGHMFGKKGLIGINIAFFVIMLSIYFYLGEAVAEALDGRAYGVMALGYSMILVMLLYPQTIGSKNKALLGIAINFSIVCATVSIVALFNARVTFEIVSSSIELLVALFVGLTTLKKIQTEEEVLSRASTS